MNANFLVFYTTSPKQKYAKFLRFGAWMFFYFVPRLVVRYAKRISTELTKLALLNNHRAAAVFLSISMEI